VHISNEITIAAPPQRIFAHASDTPHWPQMLPHYRYVRVLSSEGSRRVVEMAARRPFDIVKPFDRLRVTIPVRWRAEQIDDPAVPGIFFRHLGGWTKGMRVWWRFTALHNGKTRVRIDHELDSPLAPFIGRFFIHPIASRTLARMKEICEA
jgi:ribosome-associated toxin RatA of RatAB toxin-antitoxin module